MLLSLAIWLQNTGLMRALRESDRGYETLLSLHVSFIALSGAMIAITDARLLGVAPGGYAVSDIVDQLRWPKRIGFLCVATCGFLLFGMKAEEYYLNIFFRLKVLLFSLVAVHALIFRPLVYNRAAEMGGTPTATAKTAAVFSLLLWFGIVCAGRGIGYIHPPPFSHHFARTTAPGIAPRDTQDDARPPAPSASVITYSAGDGEKIGTDTFAAFTGGPIPRHDRPRKRPPVPWFSQPPRGFTRRVLQDAFRKKGEPNADR